MARCSEFQPPNFDSFPVFQPHPAFRHQHVDVLLQRVRFEREVNIVQASGVEENLMAGSFVDQMQHAVRVLAVGRIITWSFVRQHEKGRIVWLVDGERQVFGGHRPE